MRPTILHQFLTLGTRGTSDLEAQRRGALVNGLSAVGLFFLSGLGVVAALRGVASLAVADFSAATFLVLLLAYFWKTGRYNAAAHVGVILIGIAFVYFLASGGEAQTAFVWYYVFPLMATFLLGARRGLVASGILLGIAVTYFFIDPIYRGWADYAPALEVRFCTSFVVVAVFSFIYERMRSDTATALRGQTEALRITISDLTAAQTDLSATNERLSAEVRQRMEAVAEMRRATAKAEAASEAKSKFLANMSHELRTPLNHVIGFSEVVLSEKIGVLNDRQREYLGDVVSAGRHLLAIISDILDLSRVEAGKMEARYARVNLRALVRDSVTVVVDQAEQKRLNLRLMIDNLPESAIVDGRMIRQVLYNLLQNAVKFTPEGGSVTVTGSQSGATSDDVIISVTDTGIGLDRSHFERVFEDFEQVGNDGIAREGTGLGLALSRRLVEVHEGRIWADSDGPGCGSTFAFCIPISPRGGSNSGERTSGERTGGCSAGTHDPV